MQRVRYSSLSAILVMLAAACQSDRTSGPIANTLSATAPSDVNITVDCGDCVFGPSTYFRGDGPSVIETETVTADPTKTFILELDDLGTGAKASVTLNGVVLTTGKVGGGSGKAFFNVSLLASNTLEIQLTGKPGEGQLQVKVRELRCSPELVPELEFDGVHPGAPGFSNYEFNVPNSASFAPFLFQHWPGLPPCGTNTNESRSWVDIYAKLGPAFQRVYGFCALPDADALNTILFPFRNNVTQPTQAFMTINDRACGIIYTSNTVDLAP